MAVLRFHERQRLQPRHRWLVAFPPALFTALAIAQRWVGHPLGQHALSDRGLASLSILLWLVYVWLSRVELIIEVNETAITVRMGGLARRHRIPLTAVRSASIVVVDADRDFGGMGFRTVNGGRAYIARSAKAVRLELNGGGFAIIGSTRPDELAEAVQPKEGGPSHARES